MNGGIFTKGEGGVLVLAVNLQQWNQRARFIALRREYASPKSDESSLRGLLVYQTIH